jgi:signal transduction histidine kinase
LLNSFMEIGRLDWCDPDSADLNPLDLGETLRAVAARHRAVAEQKGLGLLCHAPSRMIVATDRVKVERILSNLIDNAIKFTHSGIVELVVEARANDVAIHVSDTGVGIAAENQAAVFNDFYQVHNSERNSRKGFGLGLAIARRLAQQLGGQLTVESAPGRGSRFTLILPVAHAGSRSAGPIGGASGSGVIGKASTTLG